MTLSQLITDRASQTPKGICLRFEERPLTFADLDRKVTGAANGLLKLDLKAKERVAILMDNSPEYIISYFAVIRAGGIVIPLNTFLTPDEIVYILNDATCGHLIYSDSFSGHITKIKEKCKELEALTFEDIPSGDSAGELPGTGASEDDVAVFLYTSGTTGFPKGAMLTHRNLLSNAEASNRVMRLSGRDRILLFLPLFHSFSFTVCVILPIYAGSTIILLKSVKPFSKIIKSVFRDRITFFVGVPTIYNILSRKKMPFIVKLLFRFLVRIKACISGAAALPEKTIRDFEERFGLPLLEGYGLTEASPAVAVNPLYGVHKVTSVGPPLPGIEVKIMGKDGTEVPVGETGEIVLRGPNVMKGYHNKPEETEETLRDGWLYTGDLGRVDEEGYIYIVDRKKDLIIIDGMNVYPREIEEVAVRHDAVDECAMVGIPDGKGSELSILFVKLKEEKALDDSEMRSFLKERLAAFKIPRRILVLDEFPKTSTGKIRKNKLREWKL